MGILQSMFSFPVAMFTMAVFMLTVRRMNRYDPKPLWIMLLHFAWGAFGAATFAGMANTAIATGIGWFVDAELTLFTTAVLIAPLTEEPSKAVVMLFTGRLRRFQNITDGIAYGAAVGFGFAMTENYLYFSRAASAEDWFWLVLIRTLFSAMLHALATGMMGGVIGFFKMSGGIRGFGLAAFFTALVPSMLLHSAWNFLVSVPGLDMLGFMLIGSAFAMLLLVYYGALFYERKRVRAELSDEIAYGYISEHSARYAFRAPETYEHERLARMCYELAFARIAARNAKDVSTQQKLAQRTAELRSDISRLGRALK